MANQTKRSGGDKSKVPARAAVKFEKDAAAVAPTGPRDPKAPDSARGKPGSIGP
jgi:hypothetical protein